MYPQTFMGLAVSNSRKLWSAVSYSFSLFNASRIASRINSDSAIELRLQRSRNFALSCGAILTKSLSSLKLSRDSLLLQKKIFRNKKYPHKGGYGAAGAETKCKDYSPHCNLHYIDILIQHIQRMDIPYYTGNDNCIILIQHPPKRGQAPTAKILYHGNLRISSVFLRNLKKIV